MKKTSPGVDLIVDFIGRSYFTQNLSLLNRDGTVVFLAMMSGPKLEPDTNLLPVLFKRLTLKGSTLRSRTVEYQAELLSSFERDALPLIKDGKMRVEVHEVFEWDKVVEGQKEMEANKNSGKVSAKAFRWCSAAARMFSTPLISFETLDPLWGRTNVQDRLQDLRVVSNHVACTSTSSHGRSTLMPLSARAACTALNRRIPPPSTTISQSSSFCSPPPSSLTSIPITQTHTDEPRGVPSFTATQPWRARRASTRSWRSWKKTSMGPRALRGVTCTGTRRSPRI